jgi:ABC-type branched-subunit amino acid transport system substrate-binding protein
VLIKRIAVVAAAVACAAALAACGSSGSSGGGSGDSGGAKGPVHVELISMKIPGLDLLDEYAQGAQAATKAINAAGGFGGRKVVLGTCNSMEQPAQATECAHSTLASKPVAMWGCENSWGTTGLEIYAAEGIPSFNCLNSKQDFTNPSSFGIFPGGTAEYSSGARYICTLPNVKKVVWISQNNPEQMQDVPPALTKIYKGCGKQISFVWFPFTAVDVSPYVQKVMQSKPDFVMVNVSGAAFDALAKGFQQDNYPTSKIWSSSVAMDYDNVMKPAGSAMNGMLMTSEMANWDDTSDPAIAAYLKATKGQPNPLAFEKVWGWIQMYWFYTVAKKIGFDKFDATSLTHFMRTQNGVPIPGSRTLINPGPASGAAVKQPYSQVVRYVNGKFQLVTQGTDHGWVNGY